MKVILPSQIDTKVKEIHLKLIRHFISDADIVYSDDPWLTGLHLEFNCFLINHLPKELNEDNCKRINGIGWFLVNESGNHHVAYKEVINCETTSGCISLESFLSVEEITKDTIKYLNYLLEDREDDDDIYLPQDPISAGIRYYKERTKWKKAGKPVRSQERVEELFKICSSCDYFEHGMIRSGFCGICGCGIKKTNSDTTLNKLSWATTSCPLKDPKWGPDTQPETHL